MVHESLELTMATNAPGGTACLATRTDGNPCKAHPSTSGYCWWHDPDRREQMLNASRKGGSRKAVFLPEIECEYCIREQCERLDCMNSINYEGVIEEVQRELTKY